MDSSTEEKLIFKEQERLLREFLANSREQAKRNVVISRVVSLLLVAKKKDLTEDMVDVIRTHIKPMLEITAGPDPLNDARLDIDEAVAMAGLAVGVVDDVAWEEVGDLVAQNLDLVESGIQSICREMVRGQNASELVETLDIKRLRSDPPFKKALDYEELKSYLMDGISTERDYLDAVLASDMAHDYILEMVKDRVAELRTGYETFGGIGFKRSIGGSRGSHYVSVLPKIGLDIEHISKSFCKDLADDLGAWRKDAPPVAAYAMEKMIRIGGLINDDEIPRAPLLNYLEDCAKGVCREQSQGAAQVELLSLSTDVDDAIIVCVRAEAA